MEETYVDRPNVYLTLAANRTSPISDTIAISIDDLCEAAFAEHVEQARKDGAAFIPAKVTGRRKDENVEAVSALVYDIDGKMTVAEVEQAVAKAGFRAVVYTTFNHGRTQTTASLRQYTDWAAKRGLGSAQLPTDASLAEYCQTQPKLSHLTKVALASFFDDGTFVIEHEPEHKCRAVLFLRSSIPAKAIGATSFKALYHRVGRHVFGDCYDTACCNPARLQYLPSHPPGAVGFLIKHMPGELLTWQDFHVLSPGAPELPRPRFRPPAASETRVPPTRGELQNVLTFIPSNISWEEWYRALAAIFHVTGGSEHGRLLAHAWSARDDHRYREDETDGIWRGFAVSHDRPATMGTLVHLARKYSPNFKCKPGVNWNAY